MLDAGHVLNDRYRIEKVVGRGGMGAVYLATHLQLQEKVAVKELTPPRGNPALVEVCEAQFRTEARILNRLRHPNLPRVYDFFELQKQLYIVMDYIKGGTLIQVVKTLVRITEDQCMEWARQLCDVLRYLHTQDPPVIFKDLKPDNIMLEEDGTIRLIDFGIAKVFDADQGASTLTVLRAATHGFSAPEQYGEGGTDARSDIYSLGATLYSVLTRTIPPSAMMVASGVEEVEPLNKIRPDVTERTLSAIEWMMQVRQEMRPPSIAEVQEALGFTTAIGVARTTLPQQVRQLLREEFHHFFPSPEWLDRGGVLQETVVMLEPPEPDDTTSPAPMAAVVGEPGLGKSRLLQLAAQRLKDSYEVLPIAYGSHSARHQPFGLILPSFSAWLRAHGPAAREAVGEKLSTQEISEAAQSIPELKMLVNDEAPTAMRGPMERARSVMAALLALIEVMSAEHPVLMVLDDMQWTDEVTLKLLDTLRMGSYDGKVAVLLAVDDTGDGHPCVDFIERWAKKGELLRIKIPPLSVHDIARYASTVLPPVNGLDAKLNDLLNCTRGNPLALEEMFRFMVARRLISERGGSLVMTDFRSDILPRTLDDTVRRRREHLPVDAQKVLSHASVIGKRFDLRTLLKLTGETTSALAESLSGAVEGLFVTEERGGRYSFSSETTRRVFYDTLAPPLRNQLHRKLGTMEEERAARSGEVANAGYHYEQAGDVDKSLEFLARLSQEIHVPKRIEVLVGDAIKLKGFKDTVPLSVEQVKEGLKALSMLVRSMRSMEIYGPRSPITQTSFGTAMSSIKTLVLARGTLGYSLSEEAFHINQNEVPMDQLPTEVSNVLKRHRISGFEFQPGVEEREFREFVDLLLISRDGIANQGGWMQACKEHNIVHIVINEIVYIGVAEKDLFDASKLKAADEVVVRSATGNVQPVAAPAPVPVAAPAPGGTGLDGVDSILSSLSVGAPTDAVLERLDRLHNLLSDMRSNASAKSHAPTPTFQVEEKARTPELPDSVRDLLRQARVDEILRLVGLMNALDVPLKTFMETRPELLLRGLENPDRDQRTLSAMGLMNMGQDARRWLIQYLRTSTHALGRATAVYLFCRAEADPSTVLAREALSSPEPGEAVRLLQAMQLAELPWAMPLATMLVNPVRALRRGALQVLLDAPMPTATKLELLQLTLQSDHLMVLEDAVFAIGELKEPKSVQVLVNLTRRVMRSETAEGVRVIEQVCHALGRIGSPLALPFLKSILKRSLLRGAQDPVVRSAAVLALRNLPGDEARDLVRKHQTDADANVNFTARHLVANEPPPTDGSQYHTLAQSLKKVGLPADSDDIGEGDDLIPDAPDDDEALEEETVD